jgi:hypothetical protein
MHLPPRLFAVQFVCLPLAVTACLAAAGCGATRWSDSKRTATEQLLLSDAVDRAVTAIDMRPLAGHAVFLDTAFMDDVSDAKYLASTLRHQLIASGCRLAPDRESAEVIVEARAGALGTDRSDLLIGIPATSVEFAGSGTTLPEMAAAKRTDQRAVAKVSLFAYEAASGRPIWQSGLQNADSSTRDRWVLGGGPFRSGDISKRVEFAGEDVALPWQRRRSSDDGSEQAVAGRVDLDSPKVFAALPHPGPPAAERPVVADERPVDLPPVR